MSCARKFLLGRPTNNLTGGIVGLANVGKSTFFQAITNSKLGNPANYPFATIEPEEAKVQIPSKRLDHLFDLYGSKKKIPATLTIYDIAGLVRGASSGEGMGSAFLNDIRHVDGIYHVVRAFENTGITHVEGTVEPIRDLSIVQDELILKDLEFLENIKEKLNKKGNRFPKNSNEYSKMQVELDLLQKLEEHLYEGKKIIHYKKDWELEDISILNKHNFLTAKPSVILLNVTPNDYLQQQNKHVEEVKKWIAEYSPGDNVLLFSAEFETIYNEFKENDNLDGLREYCNGQVENSQLIKTTDSALPDLITKMREALRLISFFTCGPLEVRQWTIREGTTAPEASGVIHTDLQDTFISANIISYADVAGLIPPLQEATLRSQGKIKRAGKQYIMNDGDIALFKAAGAKTR